MRWKSTLFALVIVVSSFALSASPASAASCHGTLDKGPTYTRSTAGTCSSTQARIDRYISSYPTPYLGSWGPTSYVSATSGVESGHAFRSKLNGVTSDWNWF